MIKIKRFSVITLIIFFVVNIINVPMIKNVQALDDVKLVSTCRVTKEEAQNWARSKGATATFVNLANYYWKYSDSHGNINPSIAYVQAAKETGYGKFGGVIKEDYHNPCGLKTEKGGDDKDPNAHQKFNSWDEGVQAHLDHMALYAGLKGYPRKETYDPRHFSYLYGKGGDSIITMSKGWATDRNYGENLLKLYYNLLSYKTPKMWVEDINVSYSGSSKYLNVKGWSINATGIKSVQVYADNKLLGNAQIGLSRPDVKNAYSTYIGSENAGFTAKFDITKSILSSKSTIKIVSIGNDGVSTTSEKTINIEKPAPKMWVEDISVESSGSSRYLNVKGWAINATEVQCVKVYVGNTLLGNAQIGLSRPDIKKNYPNYYRSENAGFTAKFDVTKIKPISNTPIKVIAFGTDGTTTASTKVLPEQKMWVEDISIQESGLNKYLNIRGWAVNITGIKSVQVYADDKFIGNAQIGLSRPDIKKNYPNYYESENAGFTAKFDITSSVAPGVRTIKVVATGNDGVITSVNKYVSITKKSKLIVIDSGHGGITSNKQGYQDPGTVCGEYIEAELNMKVALELQKDLENLGYRTAMTNTPLSQFVDLMPRSELANSLNADLFISLHHNSFTNSSANGIETHYYSKSKASDKNKQISKEFATKVNNNLCKDYIDGYKYRNRYSKDSNFSVIRETKIPSVLIELGFLTNPNEAKHCASVKDQQIKANIIANTVKSQM